MNEKIKANLEKAKTALGKVSKKIWVLIAVALVLVAAGITIFLYNRPYSVLITSQNAEEISTVMSWLETQGIQDYRMEGMSTILVPSGQETNLKARLMMEGYPKQGFSYESYYSHVSTLSTEAERKQAYLNSIQDRLGAIIEELEGVSSAVVTLTQSSGRGSVLSGGNEVEASAAVEVTMRSGAELNSKMANAIRNFVAHAVQGLKIDSVVIIDSYGNTYSGSDVGNAADSDAYALKTQLEESYANKVRRQVYEALVDFYGAENLKVEANCVVEMSTTTIKDYQVGLPEYAQDGSTGGRGIIGTMIYDHQIVPGAGEGAGGVVGTESNADWPQYVENPEAPDDDQNLLHTSGETIFDNSKTQTETYIPIGQVTDCTVAVSINSTTAGAVDIEQVIAHAARAAGINAVVTEEMTAEEYLASKISVMTAPFYVAPQPGEPGGPEQPGTIGGIPLWIIIAAAAGILLFVVLLVVILILRGKKKKKQQELEEQQNASVEELLEAAGIPLGENGEPETGADVMDIQTERSMELRKDIRQFVDENPEIAATMIKSWLKGDDDNG